MRVPVVTALGGASYSSEEGGVHQNPAAAIVGEPVSVPGDGKENLALSQIAQSHHGRYVENALHELCFPRVAHVRYHRLG
jgi:hypothetical protein